MIDPIIVTGCARSGTSMTAGMINICGAFGGEMFGPNKFNQKGMFENIEIRQNVSKPYLKKIGVDPLGQKPLPNNRQVFEVSENDIKALRTRVQLIMQAQGYVEGPWFYKGAKACLVWYLWSQAFPGAKWVIVRRDPLDIARSCMRTRFMRAYSNTSGWLRWVDSHLRRFDEMKSAELNVKEFWPSTVIDGDYAYAQDFIQSLGLTWKDSLVKTFVDPTLYRRGK